MNTTAEKYVKMVADTDAAVNFYMEMEGGRFFLTFLAEALMELLEAEELTYRIYASDFYPVDTNDGKNIICLKHSSNSFRYSTNDGNIKRFWAITATDRYGNESSPLELNRPADDERIISVNRLPEAPEGCTVVVNDVTGMELFRTKSTSDELIKKLHKGIYSIQYVLPDGKQENITLIISEHR